MHSKFIVLYTDGSKDKRFYLKDYSLFYGRKKVFDLIDDNFLDIEQYISNYAKLKLNKDVDKICDTKYNMIIE